MDVFDTVTTVVGYADSEEEFEARAQEFHDEMVEYHQLYDIYNDYEGVSNIKTINDNAGVAPVEVDERIIDLLVFARDMCEATDGKTNAGDGQRHKTVARRRAAAESDANLEGTPPSEDEIAEALTHISFDTIVIDEAASTVFITDPAQSIDVGSIAKGYAVEQAASQFDDLLISAGGNVRAAGTKPDGSLWAVGVQNPDGGSEYAAVLNGDGRVRRDERRLSALFRLGRRALPITSSTRTPDIPRRCTARSPSYVPIPARRTRCPPRCSTSRWSGELRWHRRSERAGTVDLRRRLAADDRRLCRAAARLTFLR